MPAEAEKTKDIIQSYYESLRQKRGWEAFLSEDMLFINNGKRIQGKSSYLEATKRFFSTVQSLEVMEMVVEGDKGCASVRYDLKSPRGKDFTSDVAEFFRVKNGRFTSFAIYFDTAPFNP